MNRGQLNGFALNGSASDPVVRVRIDAKGYARVRSGGRVLAYGKVYGTAVADLQGKLGRVEARLSGNAVAQALATGVLGRVDIRSILAHTGRAVVHVTLPPIYGRVRAKVRAMVGLKAHVEIHTRVASIGRGIGTPEPRLLRRAPVRSKGSAQGSTSGTVFVRRWLRSPIEGRAHAFIASANHTEARLSALVRAQAFAKTTPHVLRRALVQATGSAVVAIDPSIFKQLPFDEPAPDARTFDVPEIMTTFDVSERGDAMFKSPPMQPADTQDWDINFDKFFPPGDEIVGVTLSVQPPMPLPPSFAFLGQRVKVWVYAGGTDGQKYKISVTATTNDGRVKQAELIVPIKEV